MQHIDCQSIKSILFVSTFTKYLNDVWIDEAKRMLHEEMEIADIAGKCGSNSPNYFCKVFKNIPGHRPGIIVSRWLTEKRRR